MNFIEKPYLPINECRIMIIDSRAANYAEDMNYIPSYNCNKIMPQVSSHPDMTICHLGKNIIIAEKSSYKYYKNKLEKLGFSVIEGSNTLEEKYPFDIAFNCVILNGMFFHKLSYTDEAILREAKKMNLKLIDVPQGYTKCSTLIVNENSVITGDPGLHRIYTENNLESLLITNEGISLDGFDNGFIGGAGGLISSDKMVFFGDIESHKNYDDIKIFLNERGISIVQKGYDKLYDFGSIITLMEDIN